ncbi:4-alpha-glucanotransferase [Bordetella sp. 2513F-2]
MAEAAASDPLERLAGLAGIQVHWTDAAGRAQRVAADTLRAVLEALDLPAGTPAQLNDSLARLQAEQARARAEGLCVTDPGAAVALPADAPLAYEIRCEDGSVQAGSLQREGGHWVARAPQAPGYHVLEAAGRELPLAVCPAACPGVEELIPGSAARAWGVAAQVGSLRHAPDEPLRGGYGDFAALQALAETLAGLGADALAMSPVHAMFSADLQRYSPYSPSSRLFLNVLYAAPQHVLGLDAVRAALHAQGADVTALEAAPLVDWPCVAALRLDLLRRLHADWPNAPGALQQRYTAFVAEGGVALQAHAGFEARAAGKPGDPREIDFHCYAQWLAAESLDHVQQAARRAGMGIGLVADLAVGSDPEGSQVQADPAAYLSGMTLGAPPDLYNAAGQSWGITAFAPHRLRATGYRGFLQTLRAALRHAGGVRIDHILGLSRLWAIPRGAAATEGAYLRCPLDDLLRLTALEARRHHAIIVGENLGTVPPGLNQELARRGVLGTEVLWFQRDADATGAPFLPPSAWSPQALAMPSTHDLPTLRGWWRGRDLTWGLRLGTLADTEAPAAQRARDADRTALWQALVRAGLAEPGPAPAESPTAALLGYVASTPAPLMLAPLEDIYDMEEQPNIPGTLDIHPNWRRRLPAAARALPQHDAAASAVDAIRRARRRP